MAFALAVALALALLPSCLVATHAPFAAVRWDLAEAALPEGAALPARFTAFQPRNAATLLGRSAFRPAAPLRHHDRVPAGEFPFPLPDGRVLHCRLVEYALLAETLESERHEVRTFFVHGAAEDEYIRGALTYTADGWSGRLHAAAADSLLQDKVVLIPSARFASDDAARARAGVMHLSYWQRDFHGPKAPPFSCGFDLSAGATPTANLISHLEEHATAHRRDFTSGSTIRSYRIILSATAQYALAASGGQSIDVSRTYAELISVLNVVNSVYQSEFSVTFTLVSSSNVISVDSSDALSSLNNDGIALISNHGTWISSKGYLLNSYDIGHVLTTGSGGVALYASVCVVNEKYAGTSGTPSPLGNAFVIDYVCHEIGHQVGGAHTFNGIGGNCDSSNYALGNAVEPGSASTIMGYTGICGSQNLQENSDPYFSWVSLRVIDQVLALVGTCASTNVSSFAPPQFVNYSTSLTVPIGTPFYVESYAICPGRNCTPTYICEEADFPSGQVPLSSGDTGNNPIFRSWPPTSSSRRSFPVDPGLGLAVGEFYPSSPSRAAVNVVCTARVDTTTGGQRVRSNSIAATVNQNAGPFVLTSLGCPTATGAQLDLVWTVENTNSLSANVSIEVIESSSKSTNVLVASTPNDGAETVVLPSSLSGLVRVRVRSLASSSPFFSEYCTSIGSDMCDQCQRSSSGAGIVDSLIGAFFY